MKQQCTLHTSDIEKLSSTSQVATYEEHGSQMDLYVLHMKKHECQDGFKSVYNQSSAGEKRVILAPLSSKGGPPDHIRASDKIFGCSGGGSVEVVLVVAVKLEGTPADAVRALKKLVSFRLSTTIL
ncbi:hypothetical protein Tco_0637922 [Tanacetum coccineum]